MMRRAWKERNRERVKEDTRRYNARHREERARARAEWEARDLRRRTTNASDALRRDSLLAAFAIGQKDDAFYRDGEVILRACIADGALAPADQYRCWVESGGSDG